MKCRYCGYEIPEGELHCENCGKEVFIVPDYNPLEDMLTAQIKVGIGEERAQENLYEFPERSGNRTRDAAVRRDTGRNRNTRAGSRTGNAAGRNTASRNTMSRNTARRELPERERRRRQAERRKAALRKRRRIALLTVAVIAAAVFAAGSFLYQNSYNGLVKRGYKAADEGDYNRAEEYFQKAIAKNEKKAEAYAGLSKIYLDQKKAKEAEQLFEAAVKKQPENADIYEAFIEFYIVSEQPMSIPALLDEASDRIREKLKDYIIEEPRYNLSDEEVYDDVQQLEIIAEGNTVYYTTDGTEPSLSSTKYTEPVQLGEGETVVRAIAVDERGIPSLSVEKTYTVEFPIEDAPAVSPSTGQYESPQQIEIKVPEGYEAYYTMNGEDPTTACDKYTGPVNMPEGETLFKAILVNSSGRASGVTTRNYMLEIEE